MRNVTDCFDYTHAQWVLSENSPPKLVRDWQAFPPTQLEVEALLAHWLQFDRFLSALVSHVARGDLVIAEGLDGATAANVMRFLVTVGDAVTPPTTPTSDEAPDAGAG